MKSRNADTSGRSDPVEAVLRQARPRPVPPVADEQAIREAVQAEWRSMASKRKSNRRMKYAGIAASVLVAVSALVMTLSSTTAIDIEVARIDRSIGTIYRLGDRAELIEVGDVATIHSGQVIVTGQDSALGLDWGGGGSLRVDAKTRIEFVDATSVFLHQGRIYFDSIDGESELLIQTDYGTVTHLGTQYMTEADRDKLVISVREGEVSIDGRYYDQTAGEGKQVEIRGSARPVVVDMSPRGPAWTWTESMSPGIELTNRSTDQFLEWVGRETGYEISYESADAEILATGTRLIGKVEADPRTELRLRMLTTDLDYAFDEGRGTINVSLIEGGQP